jgi:hypothetical protein
MFSDKPELFQNKTRSFWCDIEIYRSLYSDTTVRIKISNDRHSLWVHGKTYIVYFKTDEQSFSKKPFEVKFDSFDLEHVLVYFSFDGDEYDTFLDKIKFMKRCLIDLVSEKDSTYTFELNIV